MFNLKVFLELLKLASPLFGLKLILKSYETFWLEELVIYVNEIYVFVDSICTNVH